MADYAEKWPIQNIELGTRYRKDLGDIRALADNIQELGILHPVVVTPDGVLIAGARRLAACRTLNWTEVPVHIVPLEEIARGEFAENVMRKDFLPSEMVAITRALEPVEREAAKERQQATQLAGRKPDGEPIIVGGGNFPPPNTTGKTRDKVASYVGVSGRTLEKATKIIEAAEAKPEKFKPLVEKMDRTGKVDGAYRKLQQSVDEDRRLNVVPPTGKYRTIIIDPPWDYEGLSLAGRGRPEYAVMSQEELLALPVDKWADDECHLYLWTTIELSPD